MMSCTGGSSSCSRIAYDSLVHKLGFIRQRQQLTTRTTIHTQSMLRLHTINYTIQLNKQSLAYSNSVTQQSLTIPRRPLIVQRQHQRNNKINGYCYYYYYSPILSSCISTGTGINVRQYSSSSSLYIPNRNTSNNNSGGSGKDAFKEMYAIPYTISPDEALDKFEKWARNEQGLGRILMNWNNVQISAVYTPVWSFNLNVRFILIEPIDTTSTTTSKQQRKRMDWKPNVFQDAYGKTQTVIHLPGLSAYAGYTYRRSLIDPLHNSSLLFMQNDIVPFGGWMMRDMKLSNGDTLPVTPDPWNTTTGKAYAIVKNNLQQLGNAASNIPSQDHTVTVQTELLSSQRVYLPTYVIDYKVLPNMQFQAFVSGCDSSAPVSGVSHKIFSDDSILTNPYHITSSLYTAAEHGTNIGRRLGMGPREIGTLFIVLVQFIGGLSVRLLSRIPIIGFLVGITFGYRKIIQPWMDSRTATAEWERQRENEAMTSHTSSSTVNDDFIDTGTAQRYFYMHREHILKSLSGNTDDQHRGDYDWYKQWEQWARQQWNEQQQQQQQQSGRNYGGQQYQQQQQQQQQARNTRPKTEYQWDFDPNDPYSVLGIPRTATSKEISAAFRKQMMTYHPDMQANASEAAKARAVERSKLITEAYRMLKTTKT